MINRVTLAGGCFWCHQEIFKNLRGVEECVVGYCGGVAGVVPTYETVDDTDHAEVVHIVYDDDLISLDQLFDAFFLVHDPTQLDRQGEDQGRQYRSAIFVHNAKDLQTAQDAIGRAKKLWEVEGAHIPRTVVTTVQLVPVSDFYRAEDYHQNFAVKNPKNEYCKRVVNEKVRDARKLLRDLMKPTSAPVPNRPELPAAESSESKQLPCN
ncbi:peptide methionine sulfoxide reductase [Gregarina niphandrodes]|uniref:peptide-methionine (S)-S-oxide reductase n=1 Tax=Gregarina niphandrodes TaxID=110365 RepID=A0A023B2P1_GRENI|nr:peptide methionine sulfoxide reductase [Gregarina niphandrodes]EZG55075.1 peptide methionine sulfoxide reductase [Gregarina niphandrodes]|eukprot:XP_011131801.1 peptide methionine sulfoxide reductase [Gregarina niphandrodes]